MHCVNKNNVNPNHPTYQTVLVCSPRLTGRAFLNESDPVFLNKDDDDDLKQLMKKIRLICLDNNYYHYHSHYHYHYHHHYHYHYPTTTTTTTRKVVLPYLIEA